MSIATALMTTEEMLALPESDGIHRELIRGELRERFMTVRNKVHSLILMKVGHLLMSWQDRTGDQRGKFLGGEVGAILQRDPDTTVGIDLAYFPTELVMQRSQETTLVDGPPLFAVEILSPSDTIEDISDKVEEYLAHGVQLIWIITPQFRSVTVHRPDAEPELFNARQTISAAPILPGFECPVAALFE